MRSVAVPVDGANCLGVPEYKPYDKNCPLLGSGLNIYKSSCEAKQKLKENRECYGGCKFKKPRREKRILPSMTDIMETGGRWLEMYKSGMSVRDISDKVGFSRSKVQKWMTIANGGKPLSMYRKDWTI